MSGCGGAGSGVSSDPNATGPRAAAEAGDEREKQRAEPGAQHRMLTTADRAGFSRLEQSLGGRSGVAVSPLGFGHEVEAAGRLQTAVAWSTIKVPIAMAVVAEGDEAAERPNLRRAITASDNAAAERAWSSLGDGEVAAAAATAQLRRAGDRRTVVQSRRLRQGFTAFGQTVWSLSDQARFTAGLPCLPEGRYVLKLMNAVIRGQRWGLGSARVEAQLKGGWGPGSRAGVDGGSVDRQMGILTVRGRSYAVVIATAPADGTHASGTANLTRIATWVVEHVDHRFVPREPRCRS